MSFDAPDNFEGYYLDVLESRNSLSKFTDKDRLENICNEVKKRLFHDRQSERFTPHDTSHNVMVERALYKLIPPKIFNESKEVNSEEIFLLLAAVWLHDIGMDPELFENDKPVRGENEIIEWENKVRSEHGIRSARFIEENGPNLLLSESEIYALTKMAKDHRYRQYKVLLDDAQGEAWYVYVKGAKVRLPLLTSYLRLADALHIDHRSPEKGVKRIEAFELDNDTKYHWLKSKYVNSADADMKSHKLIVELKEPNVKNSSSWKTKIEPLRKMIEIDLQNEIDSVRDIAIRGEFPIYLKAEVYSKPTYVKDILELEKLLTYTKLFKIPMSPTATSVTDDVVKEIDLYLGFLFKIDGRFEKEFTNRNLTRISEIFSDHGFSIDEEFALSRKDSKDSSYRININGDTRYIVKKHHKNIGVYEYRLPTDVIDSLISYKEKKLNEILLLRPRHTYNRIVENILNKLLIVNKNDVDSYEISLDNIQKAICILHEKMDSDQLKLENIAYEYITKNNPILVYGYSSTVLKCLKFALKEDGSLKNKMKIYVCGCTTLNRYRYNNQLVYSNGVKYIQRLKEAGFKNISYITDSCSSNLFSRNMVKGILFGVNGIDVDGNVAGPLGQLAIADAAKVYNIPIFVLANSLKIIKNTFGNKNILRGNNWLTTDIENESILNAAENYNPREDIIPGDRIKFILTEQGCVPPKEIGNYSLDWNDIMKNSR